MPNKAVNRTPSVPASLSVRHPVKVLGSLILAILVAALAYSEISWRLDHVVGGPVVADQNSHFVAQVRTLPERSPLPYGHGVYVRRSFLPLWASSRLVLAAYCKGRASVSWVSARHVEVRCESPEGEVLQPANNLGITVSLAGET